MRRCPYCKIEVGGDLVKCPLCQSKLSGDAGEPCYPKREEQQKRSFLYKLQLFFAWVVLIVGLGLDFSVGLHLPSHPQLHWSLLLAMWIAAIEFGIMRQLKPGTGSAGRMTMPWLIGIGLWCVTAKCFGFLDITLRLVVPCALGAVIIANFVLMLLDRNGNTMAYLLPVLLLGAVPGVVLFLAGASVPLAWSVCMMGSVVLFAAAVIFKGRAVAAELRRRFHV